MCYIGTGTRNNGTVRIKIVLVVQKGLQFHHSAWLGSETLVNTSPSNRYGRLDRPTIIHKIC